MSFTSTLRAADMGYPITSLAYKRASLLHFYGATELVDVMEGQKVRQYKMYMLVNPNTGAHERSFIEVRTDLELWTSGVIAISSSKYCRTVSSLSQRSKH